MNICSGAISFIIVVTPVFIKSITWPPHMRFISGIITSHTSKLPQQIMKAYFKPIIYPRPRTAALVLIFRTTFALSAIVWPIPKTVVLMVSAQVPNVLTTKSYKPPTRPLTSRVPTPLPPSPLTRICVVAVASGNGYFPCISLTKYFLNGIRNRMPRMPPSREDRNICMKLTSTPRM